MFEFIRIQYVMGHITDEQVKGFAPKYITVEQARKIIKGED